MATLVSGGRALQVPDDGLAQQYLAEYRGHLISIRSDLLAIARRGAKTDEEQLAGRVFRAVHSLRGASFFGLVKISELAEEMERVLALFHFHKLALNAYRVGILLLATDRLDQLLQNSDASNQADIARIVAALGRLSANSSPVPERGTAPFDELSGDRKPLRMLAVEDDLASRLLLKTFLSRYGECEVAVNGTTAMEAFHSASKRGWRYDLVCMDIMMPKMDGREAVRRMRAQEDADGISPTYGARIVMMTAVEDMKEMIGCFQDFSDAYLIKPINLVNLLRHLKSYGLVR